MEKTDTGFKSTAEICKKPALSLSAINVVKSPTISNFGQTIPLQAVQKPIEESSTMPLSLTETEAPAPVAGSTSFTSKTQEESTEQKVKEQSTKPAESGDSTLEMALTQASIQQKADSKVEALEQNISATVAAPEDKLLIKTIAEKPKPSSTEIQPLSEAQKQPMMETRIEENATIPDEENGSKPGVKVVAKCGLTSPNGTTSSKVKNQAPRREHRSKFVSSAYKLLSTSPVEIADFFEPEGGLIVKDEEAFSKLVS